MRACKHVGIRADDWGEELPEEPLHGNHTLATLEPLDVLRDWQIAFRIEYAIETQCG
jgi:hypothetical protein